MASRYHPSLFCAYKRAATPLGDKRRAGIEWTDAWAKICAKFVKRQTPNSAMLIGIFPIRDPQMRIFTATSTNRVGIRFAILSFNHISRFKLKKAILFLSLRLFCKGFFLSIRGLSSRGFSLFDSLRGI